MSYDDMCLIQMYPPPKKTLGTLGTYKSSYITVTQVGCIDKGDIFFLNLMVLHFAGYIYQYLRVSLYFQIYSPRQGHRT